MKVLIALDASPVSARAAQEAIRLFAGCDADFLVIDVAGVQVPWVPGMDHGLVSAMPPDPRWLESMAEQESGQSEVLLAERAELVGVPDPEVIATAGDVVTMICAAAEEHQVDVIVVGSHDKSALRRLFDPSVAAGVVRDTYRPVLVVSGTPPSDVT